MHTLENRHRTTMTFRENNILTVKRSCHQNILEYQGQHFVFLGPQQYVLLLLEGQQLPYMECITKTRHSKCHVAFR